MELLRNVIIVTIYSSRRSKFCLRANLFQYSNQISRDWDLFRNKFVIKYE
jgi:hypothetical protein